MQEKKYSCPFSFCTRKFSQLHNLNRHKRRHSIKNPFKCEFENCNSLFSMLGDLSAHQRTHVKLTFISKNGYKPYKCNICDKSFLDKYYLGLHLKGHTGEVLFQCKTCKSVFATKIEKNSHVEEKHKILRKYVCKLCKERFSENSGLKAHMRIHSNKKEFSCPFPNCERAFLTKGNLKSHFKTHINFINYIHLLDAYLESKTNPTSILAIGNPNPPNKKINAEEIPHELVAENNINIEIIKNENKTSRNDEVNPEIKPNSQNVYPNLNSEIEEKLKCLDNLQTKLLSSYNDFTSFLEQLNHQNNTYLSSLQEFLKDLNIFTYLLFYMYTPLLNIINQLNQGIMIY